MCMYEKSPSTNKIEYKSLNDYILKKKYKKERRGV